MTAATICLELLFSLTVVFVIPANAQDAPQVGSRGEQSARIAFVAGSATRRFDIFEINADGSGLHLITQDHKRYWDWPSDPAWSPDGKELAFVSSDARAVRASHAGIFVITVAGGNSRLLFRDDTMCPHDPAWSPDGKHLVFARGLKSRKAMGRLHMYVGQICTSEQVYTINLDGSGLQRLTDSKTEFKARPAWSPDGSTIAYMSGSGVDRAGKADIFLMRADGSNPREFTHGGGE